ncbi:hypothetical protein [Streptomyces sp. NPDC127084]|uniref:hypothetical protein n=1 Tax=Streptomyces sp. NPDC127084 TaxID=3347133 RepID=UPI003661CF13
MFTKRAAGCVTGLAVTALGLLAAAPPAGSTTGSPHSGHQIIRLTLDQTDGTDHDPTPGSTWVEFGTAALTKSGEPYGTWGYQGTVLAAHGDVLEEQVVATFDTPEGQITTQLLDQNVEDRAPQSEQTSAITGGTGRFSKAAGYIEARDDGTHVTLHIFQR